MRWALVDANGVVQNIINYDGASPYAPTAGVTVQQVNDWVSISQNQNIAQPVLQPPAPPIPDLATQLAAALINANVIPVSDINPATLATVNANLTAAGQTAISA